MSIRILREHLPRHGNLGHLERFWPTASNAGSW